MAGIYAEGLDGSTGFERMLRIKQLLWGELQRRLKAGLLQFPKKVGLLQFPKSRDHPRTTGR
jgi:hypothetical protein